MDQYSSSSQCTWVKQDRPLHCKDTTTDHKPLNSHTQLKCYLYISLHPFSFNFLFFFAFQVLLYDLRSSQPLLVKDHNYDLPIKSLHFQQEENLVLSMDSKILRLWNQHTVSDKEISKFFNSHQIKFTIPFVLFFLLLIP